MSGDQVAIALAIDHNLALLQTAAEELKSQRDALLSGVDSVIEPARRLKDLLIEEHQARTPVGVVRAESDRRLSFALKLGDFDVTVTLDKPLGELYITAKRGRVRVLDSYTLGHVGRVDGDLDFGVTSVEEIRRMRDELSPLKKAGPS